MIKRFKYSRCNKAFKYLYMEKDYMEDEDIKEEIVGDEYMDEEEEFTISGKIDSEDDYFDMVINYIQDIVFDSKFTAMQNCFFNEYCNEFDETEENKIEYTGIFQKYKDNIEAYIEKELVKYIKDFRMSVFLKLLEKRANQVDDYLADTLLSFTDFLIFKKLILEYKPISKKPNEGLSISGVKAKLYSGKESEKVDLMLDIKSCSKNN